MSWPLDPWAVGCALPCFVLAKTTAEEESLIRAKSDVVHYTSNNTATVIILVTYAAVRTGVMLQRTILAVTVA